MRHAHPRLALLAAAVLLGLGLGCRTPSAVGEPTQHLVVLTPASLAELQRSFNAESAHPRALVLLSPG